MLLRRLLVALVACLILSAPLSASYADLQCSVVSWSSSGVIVSVHNPNTNSESAKVQLTVQLNGSNPLQLRSSSFSVSGGDTINVQLGPPPGGTITGVSDDPQPIPGN